MSIRSLYVFLIANVLLLSFSFACVDLSTPATYGSNITLSSNSFYVNSNTVLCTQSYSHSNPEALFIFNSSNLEFDCNSSTFAGTDISRALYLPQGSANISIFGSCVFNDFTHILFSDGEWNNYNNNISFTNISGSSSSDASLLLEYTQNSSFSNLFLNYSSNRGIYSGYSSFNNFTNLSVLNSYYDGFYLISDSDSNNLTDSNFTNNGRASTKYYGFFLTGSSNNNLIYNNYFNNTKNVFSDAVNYFNSTYDCSSPNIIGGTCKGGNYYSDIAPIDHGLAAYPHDTLGDGISDDIGYYIRNPSPWSTPQSIDYLPLATITDGCTQFRSNSVNIFIASNITMCTFNESFSNPESYAPFYFSSAVRSFNCNNSQLNGNDNSRALYLPQGTSNLSIFGNCVFNDFTHILFSDGESNNYNNNISVSNISGSSSSDASLLLEYTQNSSFSNLFLNYSSNRGIYSGYSSFNNFTNLSVLNSYYDGFYLISDSDSNNLTDSNFTNNGRASTEYYGFFLTGSSNNNLIYNNYFNNTKNVFSDAVNYFNSTYDCSSPNIIGGTCKGGNYYSDIAPIDHGLAAYPHDTLGDGISDDIGYYIRNPSPWSTPQSIDYLPLATITDGCTQFRSNSVNIFIASNITMCTFNESFSNPESYAPFYFSSAVRSFNCNNSQLNGNDNSRALYLPQGTSNLSIFGNCVFNDFTHILFSDGESNNYNNNISVSNISGSSSSDASLLLEYTQNSSFSNLFLNYSSNRGIYSGYSSFNNFTNLSVLNSYYDGFYLISDSDSNNLTDSNFTNNGRASTEYYGFFLTGSSNNNLIYNNYFNNTKNVFSDAVNYFNSTYDCSSPNIIGGTCKGGNYYSDIAPIDHGLAAYPHDTLGDGISDDIGYYIRNPSPWSTPQSIDYLPLATITDGCTQFRSNSVNIFIASNITMCTFNESFSNPESYAPFYFSSAVRSFNCNNSQLNGNEASNALYLPQGTSNLSIFGNCVFNDFVHIIFSDGESNNYNNNISVSNISGSSSPDSSLLLEYTQNSSFSNLFLNYSSNRGIYSGYSSFNNFTNISILNSNYEGFYLISDSDSNNLTDSNFTNNGRSGNEYGLFLVGGSSGNLAYNNYFNNTNNVYSDAVNYFNRTKILGANIIGGTYLGGNYYDDYVGNDTDLDGIGDDLNYSITTIPSYDYLPLTLPLTSVNISKTLLNDTNVSAGGTLQYLINVSNNGSSHITVLNITDSFSDNLSYYSSSYAPSSNTSSSVSWLIPTNIAPASSYLLYVNLTANSNLSNVSFSFLNVTNNASISALSTTGVYANSSTSLISQLYFTNMSVSKSVTPSSIYVGQDAIYFINISNTGYVDLVVNISDILPAGLTYNSSNVSPDYSSGQTLTWLVNISSNSTYSISYSVISNTSGNLTNSVLVSATPPNGNDLSATANVSLLVSLVEESSSSSVSSSSSGSSDPRDPIRVSHNSNCSINEVLVKLGSVPLTDEFISIEQNSIVVSSGRTNENGLFLYSLTGDPIRVRVGSSTYFGPFELSSCESFENTTQIIQNQSFPESHVDPELDDSIKAPSENSPISDTDSIDSTNNILPAISESDNLGLDSNSPSSGALNSSVEDSEVRAPNSPIDFGLTLVIVFAGLLGGVAVYWFALRK